VRRFARNIMVVVWKLPNYQLKELMKILDSDIARFQALYIKHFNIKLDKLEAMDKLSKLVRQMEIVY
jgi:hypothetical protein